MEFEKLLTRFLINQPSSCGVHFILPTPMPNSSKTLKSIKRDVDDIGPGLAALPDGNTKSLIQSQKDS
jgi:hypothetical protein